MRTINLQIISCDQCPHWNSQKYYTSDSWEDVQEWTCHYHSKRTKRISLQDWNDKSPEIPKWCPLI